MADPKQDVIDMLRELAELTMLEEGDPQSFRVRAYESASQGVSGYGGDLAKLSAKELEKLDGVGKSTAAKIRELFENGRVEKLEGLRKKHPPSASSRSCASRASAPRPSSACGRSSGSSRSTAFAPCWPSTSSAS